MATPAAMPAFDNTLGSLLVGGLVAMALWGVTCVQTYTYFSRSFKDRSYMKLMVAFLLVLDTFDSALNGHILYHYLVSNYLNPLALLVPVWSVIVHVAITSVSNFIIRAMFCLRVFRLSKGNIPVTVWILMLSTADLVIGIIITAKAFHIKTFFQLDTVSGLLYANFACGTGGDLSLALALSILLWRSKTGFKQTDSLIRILMVYTVNTGMIVALDAFMGMVMYAIMPNNFIFLGFYLLLSKLYLNSYLAALNAREDLRDRMDEPVSIHLSQISHSRGRYDTESTLPTIVEKPETLSVTVETFTDRKVDHSSAGLASPDFSPRAI
jgi:hypothetical protein